MEFIPFLHFHPYIHRDLTEGPLTIRANKKELKNSLAQINELKVFDICIHFYICCMNVHYAIDQTDHLNLILHLVQQNNVLVAR